MRVVLVRDQFLEYRVWPMMMGVLRNYSEYGMDGVSTWATLFGEVRVRFATFFSPSCRDTLLQSRLLSHGLGVHQKQGFHTDIASGLIIHHTRRKELSGPQ